VSIMLDVFLWQPIKRTCPFHKNVTPVSDLLLLLGIFRMYGCIVLCCIVLYLNIYIALLEVHTNQCERPKEKKAVLRKRKEAHGSPVNKVDRG